MTTFFVFGEVPDNILRSLAAAMSIERYSIIRPGAEFVQKHRQEHDRMASAIRTAEAEHGRHSDETHMASRAFNQWRVEFVGREYPDCIPTHTVRANNLEPNEHDAFRLLCDSPSAYNGKFACQWTYTPPTYEGNPRPALITGRAYEDRTRLEYELEFTWFVRALKTTVTMLPYAAMSMTPVKTQATETEEWHYPVQLTPEQQKELDRLIAERNDMYRENSYGSDMDTNPIQHDIHMLCAAFG